jgi:hypothetical protein
MLFFHKKVLGTESGLRLSFRKYSRIRSGGTRKRINAPHHGIGMW